jgi:hypothetical protein
MRHRTLIFSAFSAMLLAVPAVTSATQWKDALSVLQQAAGQQGQANGSIASLSDGDIANGLKEALAQGTRSAVNSLGHADGFWGNAAARIPMPDAIQKMERTIRGIGAGSLVDEFHLSLNRAAEQAVPVAADVFANSVKKLTLSDVRGILTGPNNAATEYFRRTTSDSLSAKFKPIVMRATAKVGVANSYRQMTASAGPFASALGAPSDLDGFVTQKALDGLFVQVASEEARIRENPAARGTAILRKVFGAK